MTARRPLGKRFWIFWAAQSTSHLGDGLGLVAVPWVATLLTDSAVGVAAATSAGRLPWLLLALPAGVLVDRRDRLALMARANAAQAVLLVLLGWLLLAELVSLWGLLALAFLAGTAKVLSDTAAESAVPMLVGPEDLPRAGGHVRTADIVANDFLGRPLGGAALGLGAGVPFLANAVAAAASLPVLAAARRHGPARPPSQPSPAGGGVWSDVRAGLRLVRDDPTLRFLALVAVVLAAFYSAMVATQVLYVQRVLRVDALGFGLLLAVASVGAVLGSQLAGRIVTRFGWARAMLGAMWLMAAAFTGIGLAGSVPVVAALYLLTGLAVALSGVTTVSVRQRLAPPWALGRVSATFRMLSWGVSAAGMLGGGFLVAAGELLTSDPDATRVPYLAGALAVLVLLVHATRRLPALARAGAGPPPGR